tara:strand:- start:73494 stop:74687 length:1194 start_codon:yes stop_codon:yes gene_type:complete
MTDANIGKMIVAGAGPVGLTLALMLRRAGIDVTVVEKRATVNLQSKASTFHASTIDLLETCDVLDSMLAKGTRVDSVQYRAPDGVVLAQLDFDLLKDRVRNPFRMHYEQGELTTLMRDLFVKEGGDLRFNAGVSGVEQDDAGVTVTTEDGQTIRAGALFGCDGAQSFVREAVRIGYVEKPYPGMVLRLYAQTDMRQIFPGLGGIAYLHLRDETCSLLEMPDCWRIVVRVPAGVSETEAMTDEWVVDRLRNLLSIEKLMPSVSGRDVYSARSRRAFAASAGRVYLAGDALHLTNTKGGMNLNAGLHDAFAYSLAAVESFACGDTAPLDRAAWERERVARCILLPRTSENAGTGSERVKRIASITTSPEGAREFLAKQAMLDMLGGVSPELVGTGAVHV